jgi:hypothetical protein
VNNFLQLEYLGRYRQDALLLEAEHERVARALPKLRDNWSIGRMLRRRRVEGSS